VNLGKLLPQNGKLISLLIMLLVKTITPQYDPFNQDIKLKQLLENTADQKSATT
jgi:hypothetical protein